MKSWSILLHFHKGGPLVLPYKPHRPIEKMLESRPEDALVKLVKTVEIVETAETACTAHFARTVHPAHTAHPARTDHFHRIRYL